MLKRPIQRRPVRAGLSAGNDRDPAAGVMERWSVEVLRFLHSEPLAECLKSIERKTGAAYIV